MSIKPGTINPLKPNDPYSCRTAPLTSTRCILYIYSTNIGTEYFKHGIYSQFFSLQNAVCFIILTYLVRVLFTFYTQGVLKLKKNYFGAKSLTKYKYKISYIWNYRYIMHSVGDCYDAAKFELSQQVPDLNLSVL